MKSDSIRVAPSHNILPAIAMSLIVCYYAFDGVGKIQFNTNTQQEIYSETDFDTFELNIQKLRTAMILKSDLVEINGLLFQVEKSLEKLGFSNKYVEISNIQAMISASQNEEALRLMNAFHDSVLIKLNSR